MKNISSRSLKKYTNWDNNVDFHFFLQPNTTFSWSNQKYSKYEGSYTLFRAAYSIFVKFCFDQHIFHSTETKRALRINCKSLIFFPLCSNISSVVGMTQHLFYTIWDELCTYALWENCRSIYRNILCKLMFRVSRKIK